MKTNIVAAYTAGNRSGEVEKLKAAAKIAPEDGFEVAFNLACSTLQSGKIQEAKECLLLALRIGAIISNLPNLWHQNNKARHMYKLLQENAYTLSRTRGCSLLSLCKV